MHGNVARKGLVAALATALLLSTGLFVGVSYGGATGITEPQVLELVSTGCSPQDDNPLTECRTFPLKDSGGARSGEIARFRVPMADIDGNPVGRGYLECIDARKTGSICTIVLNLKDGPYTDVGTIVATGTGLPPSAITGGSGAYLNVRGDITAEGTVDDFHLFLNLVP